LIVPKELRVTEEWFNAVALARRYGDWFFEWDGEPDPITQSRPIYKARLVRREWRCRCGWRDILVEVEGEPRKRYDKCPRCG
jgi:hypothetical protein